MKTLISLLVSLSFFISIPLYAQSYKNKGKRASLVEVKKVKFFNIAEKTNTIGRLVAINPTIISSKINEEVLKINFLGYMCPRCFPRGSKVVPKGFRGA